MTYADILILLKAGYTKDEIDAMDQQEQAAPAAEPQAAPAAEPQAEPAAPAPETPAEEPAKPEPPADPTQQVLTQITELIKAVQANNRGSAEMGAEIIEPKQQALSTLRSLGGIPENQD